MLTFSVPGPSLAGVSSPLSQYSSEVGVSAPWRYKYVCITYNFQAKITLDIIILQTSILRAKSLVSLVIVVM